MPRQNASELRKGSRKSKPKDVTRLEGKPIRGTVTQFKRNMIKFWATSLMVPQAAGEVIGLCAKPKNARQVLGLDIYEAQLLCRHFQCTYVFDLHKAFVEQRQAMMEFMQNCFHPNQMATILAQLERLEHSMKETKFISELEREKRLLFAEREAEARRKEDMLRKAKEEAEAAQRLKEAAEQIEREIEASEAAENAAIAAGEAPRRRKSASSTQSHRSAKKKPNSAGSSKKPARSHRTKPPRTMLDAGGSLDVVDGPRANSRLKRPPRPHQERVGPGLGLAAPTPVRDLSKLKRPEYQGNISSNNLDYSVDLRDEDDGGRLTLPVLVPLERSEGATQKVQGILKGAHPGGSASSFLRTSAISKQTSKLIDGVLEARDAGGLDVGVVDPDSHPALEGQSPDANKKNLDPDEFLDPSQLHMPFDNALAPESNIDQFLEEAEAKPEEDSAAAFAKWSRDKYRSPNVKQYFVHEAVDKEEELDLNHFSLGEDETNMLYGYLEDNKQIRAVCLQGNRIGPRCSSYLAKLISRNQSITKLDLSNNCIGAGVVAVAFALKDTSSLRWLSLRGNQIKASAKQFAEGLKHNRSLQALDLSYNDIDDEGGYCIARALQDNKCLRELNLSWNSMGAFAGEALGQLLKWNKTLLSLSVAWNNFCCDGTIGLAEGVAQNESLQFLDVSSNRLNYSATMLFADALSLSTSLQNVQINNNPLGTAGTHLLFCASEVNKKLKHIGLNRVAAPPHTQRIAPELHYFDTLRLSGHYILNLEVRWDHAIGELLRHRVAMNLGQIFRLTYNDELLVVDFATYLVPLTGTLSFDFLSNEMLQKANLRVAEHKEQPNSVHYTLDLSCEDDRAVYASLCDQARVQAGENFVNETFNGKPFNFDEDAKRDKTESLTSGIIELDFVTTRLSHEARYQFNLRDPVQRAKATKMLERVYLATKSTGNIKATDDAAIAAAETADAGDAVVAETVNGQTSEAVEAAAAAAKAAALAAHNVQGGGDQWTNVTVDGKPVNIHEWRVNVDAAGAFHWRDEIDQSSMGETLKETWRVPTKGTLEFDLITSNPMFIFSDHYRLNLANVKDRQLAESLRVSAALQPGENWWNETLNGYRFDLQEIVSGENNRLPNRGTLEFDIVMLAPQRGNLEMKQDHYIFDLEDPLEFECANLMRKRIMKYRLTQEEFWMHVTLNEHTIPASMVWRAMWQIPTKGVLEFDYVTFDSDRRDMPRNTFKLLVLALKGVNDREKFYLLQSQSAGPDPYHMTIHQVRKLLGLFCKGTVEQRMALELLLGMLRHPHQALHLVQSVADRDTDALKYWALHAKWMPGI